MQKNKRRNIMKLRSIVIAMAIFLMESGFALSESKPVKKKRNFVPIAEIDVKSGKIKIRESILRKEFKDGGKILKFKIKKFADGYNLLRIGKSKKGYNFTEALPLRLREKLLLFFEVKKYVTCAMGECGFCRPNFEKTACDCGGGGECTLGIDTEGMGFENLTVQGPGIPPSRK
jgi:hypothetical protein